MSLCLNLKLTTMDEQTDIQWLEVCKASIQLWNLDQTGEGP